MQSVEGEKGDFTHYQVQYSRVQSSIVQYSTVQYSIVQYSTVQYSMVQYSTVQYSIVQQHMVCSLQYNTMILSYIMLYDIYYFMRYEGVWRMHILIRYRPVRYLIYFTITKPRYRNILNIQSMYHIQGVWRMQPLYGCAGEGEDMTRLS